MSKRLSESVREFHSSTSIFSPMEVIQTILFSLTLSSLIYISLTIFLTHFQLTLFFFGLDMRHTHTHDLLNYWSLLIETLLEHICYNSLRFHHNLMSTETHKSASLFLTDVSYSSITTLFLNQ